MIKATDLRLGNKVLVNGQICTVNNLFPNNIRVAELSVLHQINHESLYEPVPLTPEILEQCGFVKSEYKDFDHPVLKCRWVSKTIVGTNIKPFLRFDSMTKLDKPSTDVYYVHQLQNLYYSLTGQELEIKIPQTT